MSFSIHNTIIAFVFHFGLSKILYLVQNVESHLKNLVFDNTLVDKLQIITFLTISYCGCYLSVNAVLTPTSQFKKQENLL